MVVVIAVKEEEEEKTSRKRGDRKKTVVVMAAVITLSQSPCTSCISVARELVGNKESQSPHPPPIESGGSSVL